MAGYKIFQKPTYQELVTTLAEIGITLSYADFNYTITFSDDESASFQMDGATGAYLINRWIFADDDSHTFILLDSGGAPESSGVTPLSTATNFYVLAFIAEKDDGTLYSNNGFDHSGTYRAKIPSTMLNMPNLVTSRVSNNDPSLTELKLVHLAGNFYFASNDESASNYIYHIFKHAYVNYHRWFPFGTIISGANDETYMGWGWILFRLGATNS